MIKYLNDVTDFSCEELDVLIEQAQDIMHDPAKYSETCKGKKLATLFFEPSTRTRLSFEAAMMELGGGVLGFDSGTSSSAAKGETIRDTVKVVSNYADVIVMRHFEEGAGLVGAMESCVPIINAGDGGHAHPTQTLADLFTIKAELSRLDNITVGFCGDLKYGRTVHSLVHALLRYENVKMVFISPKELVIPSYIKNMLLSKGVSFVEESKIEECLPSLDVLYMTRIQKERFENLEQYMQVEGSYILTEENMKLAKEKMCVLHPLPRVNEVSAHIDDDPRSSYFRQAFYGKIMRKALILKLLAETPSLGEIIMQRSNRKAVFDGKTLVSSEIPCPNHRCVTKFQHEIEDIYYRDEFGIVHCGYCDKEIIANQIEEDDEDIFSDK